ncbi:MAG: hypothetical protein KatS3mg119_1665 [Rhodothalassiaceae bacterium]|nr:MAG: hypothetical protein KatS3mg119_1665 [Rhodothalassiaceae bacterium]
MTSEGRVPAGGAVGIRAADVKRVHEAGGAEKRRKRGKPGGGQGREAPVSWEAGSADGSVPVR